MEMRGRPGSRSRIESTRIGPRTRAEYYPVKLDTERGRIVYRYYRVADSSRAVIWLGGAGGGWDTPALDLYPRLCRELLQKGVASLRVRFRYPPLLEASVYDVLAGIEHLREDGIETVGLVGHSFGGAVAIQTAAQSSSVRTIVTLATQSFGATAAADLDPCCSMLLIHGMRDRTLPPSSTRYVHQIARSPKKLVLYEDGDHMLSTVAERVHEQVGEWLVDQLTERARATARSRPTRAWRRARSRGRLNAAEAAQSSAPPAGARSARSVETAHSASGSSVSTS